MVQTSHSPLLSLLYKHKYMQHFKFAVTTAVYLKTVYEQIHKNINTILMYEIKFHLI